RDRNVTGVQTCALPIYTSSPFSCEMKPKPLASLNHFTVPLLTCGVSFQDLYGSVAAPQFGPHTQTAARFPRLRRTTERPTETTRSEERRVGKGCRGWMV